MKNLSEIAVNENGQLVVVGKFSTFKVNTIRESIHGIYLFYTKEN
jgi:hypothetical protein